MRPYAVAEAAESDRGKVKKKKTTSAKNPHSHLEARARVDDVRADEVAAFELERDDAALDRVRVRVARERVVDRERLDFGEDRRARWKRVEGPDADGAGRAAVAAEAEVVWRGGREGGIAQRAGGPGATLLASEQRREMDRKTLNCCNGIDAAVEHTSTVRGGGVEPAQEGGGGGRGVWNTLTVRFLVRDGPVPVGVARGQRRVRRGVVHLQT